MIISIFWNVLIGNYINNKNKLNFMWKNKKIHHVFMHEWPLLPLLHWLNNDDDHDVYHVVRDYCIGIDGRHHAKEVENLFLIVSVWLIFWRDKHINGIFRYFVLVNFSNLFFPIRKKLSFQQQKIFIFIFTSKILIENKHENFVMIIDDERKWKFLFTLNLFEFFTGII